MQGLLDLGYKYYGFFGHYPKIDGSMSLIIGRPVLDMFECDKMLHCIYGDYETMNKSMKDVIVENYGVDCWYWCEGAFGLKQME